MPDSKNFNILQTVASGGTAVLYKALQVSLDRVVAVKRLHAHLTGDDNFTRRFVLEAKAAASLDHENIVRVIDFGVEEGSYQMVMEFVEGQSLKDILERWRPVPSDLALAVVHQVCRGLEHAHAKGIVHRDIKPGNLMLTRSGVVKITDFGLAKLTQGSSVQTAADSILGTPLYMSPEQAFGESVDQRSDLFSLGTVLYELLTGRQPFAGENYMGVIQNIIHKEIPAVRDLNPEVPLEREAIVMRALAKNREERFQSAREFRESIEQVLHPDALNRAMFKLPALLERDAATRMLPKPTLPRPRPGTTSSSWRTLSSAKNRRRSGPRAWITGLMFACVLGGGGYWAWWNGYLDVALKAVQPADEQQATMAGGSGFDPGFDLTAVAARDSSASDTTATTTPGAPRADTTAVAAAPSPETAAPAPAGAGRTEPASPALATTTPKAPAVEEQAPAAAASDAKATTTSAGSTPSDAKAKPAPRSNDEPDTPLREGYLQLTVDPSAQVYVNGVYRGDAVPTLRLTLPAGLHSVECREDRHEPYLESLRVVAGELSRRNITLRKLRGIISLASTEGADLFVDGQFIGVTPILHPVEVQAGTHTLTLKKDRYFTWTSEVVVEPNATLTLRITLSPRY